MIRGVNQAAPTGLDENPPGPRRPALDFRHCRCRNYILLEQGQPLHCFDLASLQRRHRERMAEQERNADPAQRRERALDADMLVIADEHKAVAWPG